MSDTVTANNPRIGWRTFAVFGTVSAEQEQPDHPATNLANPDTYSQWRGQTNEEQSLYVTVPNPEPASYVAVYGHNWGSRNTTVHVEYSLDSGGTWLPAITPTIPDSQDRVFFREFEEVTADAWRVRLEPVGDLYDDPPEASVLYLGRVLVLPRRIYVGHTPLPLGRSSELSVGVSTTGQFLGRVVESVSFSTGFAQRFLSPSFVRQELDPFIRACLDRPFFFAWRPASYDAETAYAWFAGSSVPQPRNTLENGMMECEFSLEGVTLPPYLRQASSSGSS